MPEEFEGATTKYRFRWRESGQEHELVIPAPSYPEACFILGGIHMERFHGRNAVPFPHDFRVDLSTPEIVP